MKLPPLPEPLSQYYCKVFDADQMQAYAFAAIEAYKLTLIEGVDLTDAIGADLWVKGRVETLIATAVLRALATERERCAVVCDDLATNYQHAHNPTAENIADECAAAIRKGETE